MASKVADEGEASARSRVIGAGDEAALVAVKMSRRSMDVSPSVDEAIHRHALQEEATHRNSRKPCGVLKACRHAGDKARQPPSLPELSSCHVAHLLGCLGPTLLGLAQWLAQGCTEGHPPAGGCVVTLRCRCPR